MVFEKTRLDRAGKFAWSSIDYETCKRFGKPYEVKSIALDSFVNSIKDIEFSFAILEYEKDKTMVSFRSSNKFDVAKLAEKLGGGGHQKAAAARLEGKERDVVNKILAVARKSSRNLGKGDRI